MNYELTLEELLKFNGSYYFGDCASVSFNIGEKHYQLPILKAKMEGKRIYTNGSGKGNVPRPATYFICNTTTGHFYIGSTEDAYSRMSTHRVCIRNKKHKNTNWTKLSQKYDGTHYDYATIFTKDREEAYDIEDYLLGLYKDNPLLMNRSMNARKASLGVKASPETIAKMSAVMSTPEQVARARAQMTAKNADPEYARKAREGSLKANSQEIFAYGTSYSSMTIASSELGMTYDKLRALAENPLEPKVYFIGNRVSPNLGIKRPEAQVRAMSERMKNDPKAIEQAKMLSAYSCTPILMNDVKYASMKEASIATGIPFCRIQKYKDTALQDDSKRYVFTVPIGKVSRWDGHYSERATRRRLKESTSKEVALLRS